MHITFDPFHKVERQAVARFMEAAADLTHELVTGAGRARPGEIVIHSYDEPISAPLPHADRPDVGASPEVPFAPSAAPLAPAPSIAAADLFPNVPAAGTVSAPPAPPVPAPPVAAVPPAPPVPSAPASTANPAPGVEADSTGLPWDERIHSGTKATNADGSWRKRRGLNDEALIKAVEAELRAGKVAPAASAAPLSQTPTVGTVGTVTEQGASSESKNNGSATFAPVPASPPASALSAATAVVPPPPVIPAGPPAVPAPPVPAGAPTPTTPPAPVATAPASTEGFEIAFGPLMSLITGNIASGKLTEPQVHEIMARPGCELRPEQIGVLAGDTDRRNMVGHALTQLLGV